MKILDEIGSKKYWQLAEEYGVGKSTISDIKGKGQELRDHKRKLKLMGCKRPSKTMKVGSDHELDRDGTIFLVSTEKGGRNTCYRQV